MTEPPPRPLGLFEAYGIELEYMIVDRASLAVAPLADRVLEAVLGEAHLALSRVAGADGNETLDATAAAPTGCVPLYFVAEAAGGAQTAFPTSGAPGRSTDCPGSPVPVPTARQRRCCA